jgi:hypothetical protein
MKRWLRALRACISLLALAVAASAQIRVLPPAASAPLGVPALLVGTPLAPAPALSEALSLQAVALAPLPAPAAAEYLIRQAASASPVERAAAKLTAARLVVPVQSARAGHNEANVGLRELAESAHVDPALSAWFDSGATAPSLELTDLTLKRGGWRRGGEKLERLGQGEFGFVDAHPSLPGAVIKTVEHSASIQMFSNPHPSETAALEQKTATALAAADAGPRHFGRAVVAGREVSVRERVYGETLDDLSRDKRLGTEESSLVKNLLRRLAAAGLKPDDMRPSNVMIGRTALDPRRRAYLVDGGNLARLPEEMDAGSRYWELLHLPIVLRGRFDPNMGFVEFSKTMDIILAEGLERSSRTTRWLRFKGFWKDFGRAMVP